MNHFYNSIHGWFNPEKINYEPIKNMPDNAIFVEVGCYKGKSSAWTAVELVNTGKPFKFFCIDPWLISRYPNGDDDPWVNDHSKLMSEIFLRNMEPVIQYITPINGYSVPESKNFADGSVWSLFVDADHHEEPVYQDCMAWLPKMVKGGYMIGHDYNQTTGVARAVTRAFGQGNFEVDHGMWCHRV